MTLHLGESGEDFTVDYREMAPGTAFREMYLDSEGKLIPGTSIRGHQASGVPGTVAGLHLAWKQWGSLPWARLVEPARLLAEDGLVVSYALEQSLLGSRKLLESQPETRRIYLREGTPYHEGEVFKQPDLAHTLRLIQERGPEAFYRGEIARQIVAEMERGGGLITADDLASYVAKLREPVRGQYRGYEIVSMGSPSSGGIILVEMLNMMERFPLGSLGMMSSDELHLKCEVMRRAFADRARYLGDSDFVSIPSERLLSQWYADDLAATIRRDWATPSEFMSDADAPATESEYTTHYSIADRNGNAVAVTTTLNGSYGSGVTVTGAGFLLNNEMDDFMVEPGGPNMFGLIQSEANAIEPRKRPLSAMTPTIVKKDGKAFLVLGSPGGPTIINTVFQVILNVIDHDRDIQEAVDAPRVHHQWMPDQLFVEKNAFARDVVRRLESMGHHLRYRNQIGDAHSIMIDPESGVLLGAPDPRSDSKASGY